MDIVTGVELECSYGAGDGRTRSGVASMPKERSGGPRLDRSCDWEKYGYDKLLGCLTPWYSGTFVRSSSPTPLEVLCSALEHSVTNSDILAQNSGRPTVHLGFL